MSFLSEKNKKKDEWKKRRNEIRTEKEPIIFRWNVLLRALWINTKVGIENKQCKSLFWGVCVLAVQFELKQARKKDKMAWKKREKNFIFLNTWWECQITCQPIDKFCTLFFHHRRHSFCTTNRMNVNNVRNFHIFSDIWCNLKHC